MRIVPVAAPLAVADEAGARRGRWAPIVDALELFHDVLDTIEPPRHHNRLLRATAHRLPPIPGRSVARFRRWTQQVEPKLRACNGRYDVIVLLQSLFAPGSDFHTRPFVVYTDNTLALTLRHYPKWHPMSQRESAALLGMEGATCRAARFVFTMSEWARRSMIQDYGCAAERVAAVGGGVTLPSPDLGERSWDRPVAMFVGIDFERKGGRTLLAAWPEVRARLPAAELWVVGPRVKRLTRPHSGVRWCGRVSDRAELASLYRQASVFVMPSIFEPWGLVFHEAMAFGLPCVGTASCAMPEIIADAITGKVARPSDPAALAEAIVEILRDSKLAERMGREAHRRVLEHHQWHHVAARVNEQLEKLCLH